MIKERIIRYKVKKRVWKDNGAGAWHFITLPKNISKEIRKYYKESEEGWGRLKVTANIFETSWNTSIWFDTKMDSYLLPIKSVIRKKYSLVDGSDIEVNIEI